MVSIAFKPPRPQYFAPEVITAFNRTDSGYGQPVDMRGATGVSYFHSWKPHSALRPAFVRWGLGVILYILLSGVPPFEAKLSPLFHTVLNIGLRRKELQPGRRAVPADHARQLLFRCHLSLISLAKSHLHSLLVAKLVLQSYHLEVKERQRVSNEAKDMVTKLMTVNPEQRLTI